MSKRIGDYEEVSFTELDKVKVFLNGMKEDQEYLVVPIEDTGVTCIQNDLFTQVNCEKVEFIKKGSKVLAASVDPNEDINEECINGNGMFLIAPYKNQYWCFPTMDSAFLHILQRAGDDCQTMRRFDETAAKRILPSEHKALRLTEDLQLYKDECLILVRWGKVRAMLSKQYVVLPADKLLDIVSQYAKKEFPDSKFHGGTWSHEFFRVEFDLNDDIREAEFQDFLEKFHVNAKKVSAKLIFFTSDIGLSSAVCRCYYDVDGTPFMLPGKVELAHTGDASVGLFEERVEKHLKETFTASEEAIEKLGNIPISNIADVLRRIQERYTFVSKDILTTKAEELEIKGPNKGTAIDVYLYLNEIVQKQLAWKGASVRDIVETSERLIKFLYLPYRSIDNGDDW